jgi:hypothetical protein
VTDEGVVKFHLSFVAGEPPQAALIVALEAWRQVLRRLGLVGQDAGRYDGFGFGNLSRRVRGTDWDGFVITGSQTGGLARMGNEAYSLVRACNTERNQVQAQGRIPPSSEALTHAAVYALDPEIGFVFHGHCPELWRNAGHLRLPVTERGIAYGTAAMAREVTRLFAGIQTRDGGLFAMGGHEDGVVSFGRTAEQAGCRLVAALVGALQIEQG